MTLLLFPLNNSLAANVRKLCITAFWIKRRKYSSFIHLMCMWFLSLGSFIKKMFFLLRVHRFSQIIGYLFTWFILKVSSMMKQLQVIEEIKANWQWLPKKYQWNSSPHLKVYGQYVPSRTFDKIGTNGQYVPSRTSIKLERYRERFTANIPTAREK